MKKIIVIFFVFTCLFACKENSKNESTTPTTNKDTVQANTAVLGSFQIESEGCLSGKELNAKGKIILANGKPPVGYEIHYLSTSDAKPIVVAKGLAFNADGTFSFKGNLPEGIPLNLQETGASINIVWSDGSALVYNGNCEAEKSN